MIEPSKGPTESPLQIQRKPVRGRPFRKGQSGNPAGKPRGTRNRATILAESVIEGETEQLMRKLVELARAGNIAALRLCVERLVPPRRERTVRFDLPKITDAAAAAAAQVAIVTAVARGELTPGEAVEISEVVAKWIFARNVFELESRVGALEKASRNAHS